MARAKALMLYPLRVLVCLIGLGLVSGGSGISQAGAEPGTGKPPQKSPMTPPSIEQVLNRHAPRLLAIPGVEGVAQGQCGHRPCLRVFVRHRTPELQQKIPAALEGYPVVIEETGEIRALPGKNRLPKNH